MGQTFQKVFQMGAPLFSEQKERLSLTHTHTERHNITIKGIVPAEADWVVAQHGGRQHQCAIVTSVNQD